MLVSLEIREEQTHQNFSISSLKALVQCRVANSFGQNNQLVQTHHTVGGFTLNWMGFIKSLTWLHTETTNMLGDRFIGNPVFQESPKHANACAGRIIIPVKLFQRCKIHCSQCKHFKIYVAHGHDSNMARHLYPQLCFLWPFQDSSVATSPGRFV